MKIFKKSTIFGEFPGEFWTKIPGEKVVGDLNSPGIPGLGIPGVQTLFTKIGENLEDFIFDNDFTTFSEFLKIKEDLCPKGFAK